MTSTFSSGQKRKRSYSEPLSMARDRRITESVHVDQIERITPAARVRRRSMEPSDRSKISRLTPVSSPNRSIVRRWHRSESPWTHHYQTEIPLSCSLTNVMTAESNKSRHSQMNEVRIDMWPKAGATDHQKGLGNVKREGGGYSDHIRNESKAKQNAPRVKKLRKATADLLHASSSSDNKNSVAVSACVPPLKKIDRKTNLSFCLVISSVIVLLLLLFIPTLALDLTDSFRKIRAANLSFIFQYADNCASVAAPAGSDDILGNLSPEVFSNAEKNYSASKLHVHAQHEALIPSRLDEMKEILGDTGSNSVPVHTVSMPFSDIEDTRDRQAETDRNLQDNLSSSKSIELIKVENSEVSSRLEYLGCSKDEFCLASVLETKKTVTSDGSVDISNTPSADGLTVAINKPSDSSASARTTSIASHVSDGVKHSTEKNRDIGSNTDPDVSGNNHGREVDSNHGDPSPPRSDSPSDVGLEEAVSRVKSARAHSKNKNKSKGALQDTEGHRHYGVDYAVWPRGGRVARPGVAVSASGETVTLTSPPHVLSLGTLKRIQHRLHLDGIADESVIISTELSSRTVGGYIEGSVQDLRSNCFIFSGSIGSATIIMHSHVNVSAVQIVLYNAPYSSEVDTEGMSEDLGSSAPRAFTLTGWSSDPTQTASPKLTGHDLGTYEYVHSKDGADEVQTFVVAERKNALKAVTVSVLSNHGADYTSLCRVKVLGHLSPSQ